jgi:hypothetical protein
MPPKDKGQSGQQSGLGIAYAEVFDDCWQEKGNSVTGCIQTEIHKSAKQNAGIRPTKRNAGFALSSPAR